MRRCEVRRCEDEKMWRWEDVKMRRCEDEKMRYRPHLLEEPCTQMLSGTKNGIPLMALWFGLPECGPNKPFLTLTRLWTPRVRRSGVPAIGNQPFFKIPLKTLSISLANNPIFLLPAEPMNLPSFSDSMRQKTPQSPSLVALTGSPPPFPCWPLAAPRPARNIFHWIKLDESWMNPSKISENLIYIMSHHVFLRFFWHILAYFGK